jgi:hypothetical protein
MAQTCCHFPSFDGEGWEWFLYPKLKAFQSKTPVAIETWNTVNEKEEKLCFAICRLGYHPSLVLKTLRNSNLNIFVIKDLTNVDINSSHQQSQDIMSVNKLKGENNHLQIDIIHGSVSKQQIDFFLTETTSIEALFDCMMNQLTCFYKTKKISRHDHESKADSRLQWRHFYGPAPVIPDDYDYSRFFKFISSSSDEKKDTLK